VKENWSETVWFQTQCGDSPRIHAQLQSQEAQEQTEVAGRRFKKQKICKRREMDGY
jgi:hypothetical protein